MEIYLIRHTTPDVEEGICYGQSNLSCAESFQEEAKLVQEFLPEQFDIVYSSPLLRCRSLAEFLFPGLEISYDDRLKEMSFGEWELQKWNTINNPVLQAWMSDFVNVTVPGGENYLRLFQRAVEFFNELTPVGRVAIVSHGGVIRSLLSYIDEVPLQDSFRVYKIPFGSVTFRNWNSLSSNQNHADTH